MIRNILILVLVVTIIYNFKNICNNITKEHFYSSTSNYCHNFDENNPKNGGKGYQCTIGCQSKVDKYGKYPFKSMKAANDACKDLGFNRLCRKNELEAANVDLCCSGWTHSRLDNSPNKYHVGYSMAGAKPVGKSTPGCGTAGQKWIGWAGHDLASKIGSGAHCCGINKTARDLLNTVKKDRTTLSTKLANREMQMHSLLTDINTTYSATKNIKNYNEIKSKELENLIQQENDKCEKEIQDIKDALKAGVDQYRKVKLGVECGEGKSCNTNNNIAELNSIIVDERTIFDKNRNNIKKLNSSLSKYKEFKDGILNRANSKNLAILSKRQREIDDITAEDTAKIKKHCNYINMNIKSINSSKTSQNSINKNAAINSTLNIDSLKSPKATESPKMGSLESCNAEYELPQECVQYVNS